MSEENTPNPELVSLKKKADAIGVEYSNNIGVDTLRERIRAKEAALDAKTAPAISAPLEVTDAVREANDARAKMIKEQTALVRIRYTMLNPDKQELPGELFTIANGLLGNVRRYIPYGEFCGKPWHVERCIYEHMLSREFIQHYKVKGKNGQDIYRQKYAPEFAIAEMTPLTEKEIAALAKAQAAANRIGDDDIGIEQEANDGDND